MNPIDIKVRRLSEAKFMFTYSVDVRYLDVKVDTLKVSLTYKINGSNLELKQPKDRFFNKVSGKYSIKRSNIKYHMVGMNNLKIEDVTYDVVRFLSYITIDDSKIVSYIRNTKLKKLLE